MDDALDCNTREPKLDHGPCNSLDSLTGPCGQALRFSHPRMTVRDTCGTNQLIDPLPGDVVGFGKAGDRLPREVGIDDLFVAGNCHDLSPIAMAMAASAACISA